jgi:EAL and modified HD-GYP domain-containing signal transduction protein
MPDAFVARQPIFNPKLDVVGYELLFRGEGYVNDVANIADAEGATARVVLNLLTELELKRIVGNKTAWVNVSREFVLGGLAEAIPPTLVGLEIPESELADEEMIIAVRNLKQRGYHLALDDFRHRPGSEPLLELFDVIKLNMPELGAEALVEQVERLKPFGGTLVAERLATQEDHELCVNAGFDLFQGYFFCRPSMVAARGIAANRLALLQVVAALNDPEVQLEGVEQLIARDVALSFRLLRYVNSAFFGLRGDVRSIGQALALLGVDNVKRWATLSVMASIDDKPTELTTTALIRARFCELAGPQFGIATPAELFTLGLFSVLDAMMDSPMHDVVGSLPLAADIRDALVRRRGKLGLLLDCVCSLETGEYGYAPSMVDRAGEHYFDALLWAETAAQSLLGEPPAEPAADAEPATAPLQSTPPPVSVPAPGQEPAAASTVPVETGVIAAQPELTTPAAPRPRAGVFARAWATVRGWFGRRVAEESV